MKKFALIVAGGIGSRMGKSLPKQFINLLGEPILMHTIRIFHHFDSGMKIIVVLPEDQKLKWKELCSQYHFTVPHQLTTGGKNRFESVKNGLKAIDEEGIVFIHDGVRPLVSRETLARCFETALKYGNAIPVLPVTESLRKQEGEINISVDRSLYVSIQTPQTFRTEQILRAFKQDYDPAFTDDASVAEKAGYKINMIEGNLENIKITTPVDLIVAEALLANHSRVE